MLSQLVYVSTRKPNCTGEEIEKIVESCRKNNAPLKITGVLLYSETKFIQLVEGEAKTIMGLYDKIKKDNRHTNPVMISYNPINEKSFPSWHMAKRSFTNAELEFKTDISQEDKKTFSSLLNGSEEAGQKVLNLLKKFF
jgi:Sensors of blue-light using FAD